MIKEAGKDEKKKQTEKNTITKLHSAKLPENKIHQKFLSISALSLR